MKVLHLAHGRKFYVWAICDDSGACQVMEMLMKAQEEHGDLVDAILPLLTEEVPNNGPPLEDPRRAKVLYRDILYELKADKHLPHRKRLGLRVTFFFDGPVVVCANAFYKDSSSTPPDALEKALEERARYLQGKEELEFLEESEVPDGYRH